jgi:RimJ/RimL family protein N-acetyltransferase
MSLLEQLVEIPKPPKAQDKRKEPERPRIELGDGDYVDVVFYHGDGDAEADRAIPWFWRKLMEDDLLKLYYPSDTERSFCTFAKMVSSQVTRVLFVVIKDKNDEVKDFMGLATWEPMSFGPSLLGHAGFLFLKDYWHRDITLRAGRRITMAWFEEFPQPLDIAVGIIAEENLLANRYVQRLGWTRVGVLPNCQQYAGKPSDAVLWQITRDTWNRIKGGE